MSSARPKVLITGAGGANGNNLMESLRRSPLDLSLFGTNAQAPFLAKSIADDNALVPAASDPRYTEAMSEVIRREGIDLMIASNDKEVTRVSADRDQFPCRVLLPPADVVDLCQDKHALFLRLTEHGIPMARSIPLGSHADIAPAFKALAGTGDRFWVRLRRGVGSLAATWVRTPEQASAWISLWEDMRGLDVKNFTISEFLPGRDYAFQSVWFEGRLVVAKLCERLSYFWGHTRLSGMSSTPQVARTLRDEATLETIFKSIRCVSDAPHGIFCMDLKGDAERMNVTEINIGRFCMITPIFDLTGKINTAEAYVRLALGEHVEHPEPVDIEEDMYLIRELDTPPMVVAGSEFKKYEEGASWNR